MKELVEATYQLQDQEHFVFTVKSTLQALTPFVGTRKRGDDQSTNEQEFGHGAHALLLSSRVWRSTLFA